MPNETSLEEQILKLLKKNPSKAYNKSELAKALKVPPHNRAQMRRTVLNLEKKGLLNMGRRARYALAGTKKEPTGGNSLSGIIRILTSGHGSVKLDKIHSSGERFVHIPSHKTSTALTGDDVTITLEVRDQMPRWMKHSKKHQVRYKEQSKRNSKELTGKVKTINKRADHSLVGSIFKKGGKAFIKTNSPSLPPIIQLQDLKTAKTGQSVVVSLIKWESEKQLPLGKIKNILGWEEDPGVDILGIIHRHNLKLSFPPLVQKEASEIPSKIPPQEIAKRLDCRAHPICTIDPHDAKDHDDAIWVERVEKKGVHQGWKLQVHIADVSHYVSPSSELDKEAASRGNSTYLVDRVIPMLPTVLSNGICSLVPDQNRLTKCALITFDQQGQIIKTEFHSAVIQSQARLSYEDAQYMLDHPQYNHEMAPHVREAWKLAKILRKKRFKNGALDLDFPEYRITLDKLGKASGYQMSTHTESHQLVEEFMLVANEAAALTLTRAQHPSLYRVHEDPDPDKLHEFGEMARLLGMKVGDLTSKQELQKVIKQLSHNASAQTLKLALLKSLKRASYTPEPLGHYGLAKANYTHFTSPIRRYADLIVHRTLLPLLKNRPKTLPYSIKKSQLTEICDHISTTERTSSEAEMESKRLKLLEWLNANTAKLGSQSAISFKALITDVRSIGLMIELQDTMLRGVVKTRDLPPGNWKLDSKNKRFNLRKKGKTKSFGVANLITVQVKHVDLERLRVDFYLTPE